MAVVFFGAGEGALQTTTAATVEKLWWEGAFKKQRPVRASRVQSKKNLVSVGATSALSAKYLMRWGERERRDEIQDASSKKGEGGGRLSFQQLGR